MNDEIDANTRERLRLGYIPTPRSIVDSSLWRHNPTVFKVAMWFILTVNFQPKLWYCRYQRKDIEIGKGELIFDQRTASEKCGITVKTFRSVLGKLVSAGFLQNLTPKIVSAARGYTHIKVSKYWIYSDVCYYLSQQVSHDGKKLPHEVSHEVSHTKECKEDIYNDIYNTELFPTDRDPIHLKSVRARKRAPRPPLEPPEQAFFEVTGRRIPTELRAKISAIIGTGTAQDIRPYYEAWLTNGWKKTNLAWLTEWWVRRHIPQHGEKPPRKDVYITTEGEF